MTNRKCLVDDCDKEKVSKGYCKSHYDMMHIRGSTDRCCAAKGDSYVWIVEQMRERSRIGCWLDWNFATKLMGRPAIKIDGRNRPAAHLILELDGRPRPSSPNDCALHSCDVPECLNPSHLRWGSRQDNVDDMISRGRGWVKRLTLDQVLLIRRERPRSHDGIAKMARHLNVSNSTVIRVIRGKTWTQILPSHGNASPKAPQQ